MIPPTSIDGTDITGATIDGTDVTEITVDGDTVFTAGPGLNDLVAPGNLVGWYPMQNNNNDTDKVLDETRTGGVLDSAGITVGDSSDYTLDKFDGSGTVSFSSSKGVFDLDDGAKNNGSYFFEADGDDNEHIAGSFTRPGMEQTIMAWVQWDNSQNRWRCLTGNSPPVMYIRITQSSVNGNVFDGGGNYSLNRSHTRNFNTWEHYAYSVSNSNGRGRLYKNGSLLGTTSDSGNITLNNSLRIGSKRNGDNSGGGFIDDVRVYDTELSTSQINQIYQNTNPN